MVPSSEASDWDEDVAILCRLSDKECCYSESGMEEESCLDQ
jgi:hypothetical protein